MKRRPSPHRNRKLKRRELITSLRTREGQVHMLAEQVRELQHCAISGPADAFPVTYYDERNIVKRATTLDVMCDLAGYPDRDYLARATRHAAKLFATDLVDRGLIEVLVSPHQPRRERAEVMFTIHIAKPNRK